MQLKFYLGHHSKMYGLQNGSFTYDIDVLLHGDAIKFWKVYIFRPYRILLYACFFIFLL